MALVPYNLGSGGNTFTLSSGTTVIDLVASTSHAVANGDLIGIWVYQVSSGAGTVVISDTAGNTYSGFNAGNGLTYYYCLNASAMSIGSKISATLTWFALTFTGTIIGSAEGCSGATFLDNSVTGTTGSSRFPSNSSGVLSQATEYVSGGLAWSGSTAKTESAGWTAGPSAVGVSGISVATGSILPGATSSLTYAPTFAASTAWICSIVTFGSTQNFSQSASIHSSESIHITQKRGLIKHVGVSSATQAISHIANLGLSVSQFMVINTTSAVARIFGLTEGQSVHFSSMFGKPFGVSQAESIKLVKAATKRVRLTFPESVRVIKGSTKTSNIISPEQIGFNQTRTSLISISITGSAAAFVLKGVFTAIHVTSAEAAKAVKSAAKSLFAVSGQVANLTRRSVGKVVSAAQNQVVSLEAFITHKITAAQAQGISVTKAITATIGAFLAEVSAVYIRHMRKISTANFNLVDLINSIGINRGVAESQTIFVRSGIRRAISVASAETIRAVKGIARAIGLVSSQAWNVVKTPGKIISTFLAQIVAANHRSPVRAGASEAQIISTSYLHVKLVSAFASTAQLIATRGNLNKVPGVVSAQVVSARKSVARAVQLIQTSVVAAAKTLRETANTTLAQSVSVLIPALKKVLVFVTQAQAIGTNMVELFRRRMIVFMKRPPSNYQEHS